MPVTAMMAAEELPMETSAVLMETVLAEAGDHDGTLFGGNALRLMGKAALAAASRHTNGKVTMARTDNLRFHQPVPIGHILELTARVIHTNQTAMTILVDGMIQSPAGGRRTLALSGYFQMIAVDNTNHSTHRRSTPR